MSMMNSFDMIQHQTDRLSKTPLLLFKAELKFLHDLLVSNPDIQAVLNRLLSEQDKILGSRVKLLLEENQSPSTDDQGLMFLPTPAARAAFGWQAICYLNVNTAQPDQISDKIYRAGGRLTTARNGRHDAAECATIFVSVFIQPLIDWLRAQIDSDTTASLMLSRYKRLGEWFKNRELVERAQEVKAVAEEAGGHAQIEKELVKDIFRYLFDQGIEFVIEPKSPRNTGMVDVLAERFPDGSEIAIEAKVFDGKKRDVAYLRKGISQAADYADEWSLSHIYLMVFNIKVDSRLVPKTSVQNGEFYELVEDGRTVRVLVLNLDRTLKSSSAAELEAIYF